MAKWRYLDDDPPEPPEEVTRFVPMSWGYEPDVRRVGAQRPTLQHLPAGVVDDDPVPTSPPDPWAASTWPHSPRSTWYDPGGHRWYMDHGIRAAWRRFRDARKAWEREHPVYVELRWRAFYERVAARRARARTWTPPDAA